MVPPVANFKEVDPELGPLNLSKGGAIPSICVTSGRRIRFTDQHDRCCVGFRPKTEFVAARMLWATPIASPIKSTWDTWLTRMAGRPAATWK